MATLFSNNTTPGYYRTSNIFPEAAEIVFKVLYVVVAGLGLAGNSFIMYMFSSKRVEVSPFNVLLLNLSISDAIAAISILPYVFIDLRQLRGMSQRTANVVCVLSMGQSAYWLAVVASTFTLFVISISRYLFIHYPLKARFFNEKHASLIIIGVIWPVAVALGVPNFLSLHYDPDYAVCKRVWPSYFNGTVFSSVTALLGFVLPVVVMIFTFVATRRYLWQNKSSRHAVPLTREQVFKIFHH